MKSTIELPNGGWKPRDYQRKGWRAMVGSAKSRREEVLLAWHRRAGKDDMIGHGLAVRAMERVGNYWHCLVTQEQARRAIWEAVNPKTGQPRWKDWFPSEIIRHVDNQAMRITFANNSTYQLFGSDNANSMVGAPPVGIAYSEAALANPIAFGLFAPIIEENQGFQWYVSSVRGRNHFYKMYQSILKDPEHGFAEVLSAETSGVFTPEGLARQLRRYIDRFGEALGRSLFNQEFLSEWDAAVVGAVYGMELSDMRREGRIQPMSHDPRYPVYTSWDFGVGDPTYILFWQLIGNVPVLFDWYSNNYSDFAHFAEVLASKPYFYAEHIGPHDTANRQGPHADSWATAAEEFGVKFTVMERQPKSVSLAAGSRLLKTMYINADEDNPPENNADDCTHILDAASQYRFKHDAARNVMSKEPVHDWTSHPMDALQQFALWTGSRRAQRQVLQGRGMMMDSKKVSISQILNSNRKRPRGAWG